MFVSHSANRSTPAHSQARNATVLMIGYGLILAVIWTPRPKQGVLFAIAAAWIVAFSVLSRRDWKSWGLQWTNFRHSAWIIGMAGFVAVAAILAAGAFGVLHPLQGRGPASLHAGLYVVWAGVQEFLLQDFFLLRLLQFLPSKMWGVLAAAAMFAVAHIPNPVLTPFTILWGIIACSLFLRYRSLYSLGIAHGILGLTIAITWPDTMTHHMMVGLGYLHYHA